jgi:predicted Zn-dependent protease
MKPLDQPSLRPLRLVAALMVALSCLTPTLSSAQDAVKALGGLFKSLSLPGKPASNNSSNGEKALDIFQTVAQPVEQIDETKEIEIGRQLSAVLLGAKPLYADEKVQRYVNQLGRWISLQSSRPNLPWTFGVIDDAGYNAFAAPGGYIFITKGLLERVPDEAELAGVLAHEITHVVAKHHLQALHKAAESGKWTSVGTQLLATQVKGDLANAAIGQVVAMGRNLYSKGLDRDDEFDADRSGVVLAARAGFDPYGLVSVVQGLRTASADDQLFALNVATHPPAQQRLDQMEQSMGRRLDDLSGQPGVTVDQRLKLIMAGAKRNQAKPTK